MKIVTCNRLWLILVIALGVVVLTFCLSAYVDYQHGHVSGIYAGCFYFAGSQKNLSALYWRVDGCDEPPDISGWQLYFPGRSAPFEMDYIVSELTKEGGPGAPISDYVLVAEEEPAGVHRFYMGLYSFGIRDGQLVSFYAGRGSVSGRMSDPKIQTGDDSEPIQFPITQDEIIRFTDAPQIVRRYHGW